MSDNGDKALILSLTDKTIKVFDMDRNSKVEISNGQIGGMSKDMAYFLLFHDKKFYLIDSNTRKVIKEIKNEVLDKDENYIFNTSNYIINSSGKYIAGLDSIFDEQGNVQGSNVFVLDHENNEIVFSTPAPNRTFQIGFTSDGSTLYMTSSLDEMTLYDVASGKLRKFNFSKGRIKDIFVSQDMNYIVVNYMEGISHIHSFQDKKLLGTIPGSTIYIEKAEDGINLVGIYNNVGTKYKDFERIEEVILPDQRAEVSSDISETNIYHPNKDLLVTLNTRDDNHKVYLIDFKTGALIQSFESTNSTYSPNILINPNGDGIIMDHSFESGTKDGGLIYTSTSKTIYYPIESYETLLEKSQRELESVVFEEDRN